MAVTPRLEIKQTQTLLMTPQLRQAIHLLQLNNLELKELLEQELETNPLLEKEENQIAEDNTSQQTIDDYQPSVSTEENPSENFDSENAYDDYDYGSDREGYESSWNDQFSNRKNNTDEDFDYITQKASSNESAYELISKQINSKFTHPKDRITASFLSTFLDKAGYFTGNLPQISSQLKLPTSYLQTILQQLQTFEPSGIFATTLKECLSIQLNDLNRLDTMMQTFIDNIELLAEGNIKALKKICHATDDDISSMISDIKSLNPKPLSNYHQDNNSYIIPDIYVRRNKHGEYIVELNQDTLPHILINQEYYSHLSSRSKKKNEQKYLKEQLNNATFLVKSLHQRATTILRISEEIVKQQRDFFEKGISHLHPMLLRDIAEAVEMHESTISRVTSNKYIHTPYGNFELKYFFSSAAGMYNGDNQTSTTSIKHKLKQLIENEGNSILSDDALAECLATQSIKIARRTVAKYREELGIPSSAQRKRNLRKIKI